MDWIQLSFKNIVIGGAVVAFNALMLGRLGFFGRGEDITVEEKYYLISTYDAPFFTHVKSFRNLKASYKTNGILSSLTPKCEYRIRPFRLIEVQKNEVTNFLYNIKN